MRVCVLASGSKGNSCFIETKETKILIDIGLNCKNIEKKLKEIEVEPKEIEAIILTHTHTDHTEGIRVFTKKYKTKVYLTEPMYKELNINLPNYEFINKELSIKDIKITSIKTSHDTDDSNGYIIENNNRSLVYITDTGYINVKNHKQLKNRNVYILESNHDVELLMNNKKYPYHIKQRILGDKGHLSNKDSSYYLSKFIGEDTKYIILAHLSEENNTDDLAINTLKETLKEKEKTCENILIAHQNTQTELIEV
ncbi:MAG: MBL fold metallo-hydrolase [Bacilli bacterium]|nr:MBL fold metallo-hydrolase [Bacilli bacterium]